MGGAHYETDQDEVDAYRAGDVRALCVVCGEVAPLISCPRCHAPLCEQHQIEGEARCASCEEALHAFAHDRRVNPLSGWMFLASLLLSSMAIFATMVLVERELLDPWWFLVTGLVGGFAPLFIGIYRRRRVRPVFLRERPGHRRLELSSDPAALEPVEPTKPPDRVAVAGMVCSLLFLFPGLSLIGVGLSTYALVRQKRFEVAGRGYAIAGLTVGVCVSAVWLLAYLG